MAKAAELKIPSDIEFRVISNIFGLIISSAGLLAGSMVREGSIDYWREDVLLLVIFAWLLFRLYRNFISTILVYQDVQPVRRWSPASAPARPINPEPVVMGQIPARTTPSAEKVVEEVARRIDEKKSKAAKKQ